MLLDIILGLREKTLPEKKVDCERDVLRRVISQEIDKVKKNSFQEIIGLNIKLIREEDSTKDLTEDDILDVSIDNPIDGFMWVYGPSSNSYNDSKQVDYAHLWGYGLKEKMSDKWWIQFSANKFETNIKEDERVGVLNEQQAYSVVERLLQVKQFGDLNRVNNEELEKFRYWRLFGHNKVLRRVWEKDSALGYKAPHERNLVMV